MMIALEKLIHLPVETASGDKLGVVSSLNLDIDRHLVMSYIVKPSLVPRLLAKELIIGPQQVVSIMADKMVVEDGVVTAGATSPVTPAT
jgi:sporulation protein YlmC with PRC-barrel domain